MLNFDNFIIRDDFYDKYCNLGGISLYVVAIALLGYICWKWESWI